MDRWAIEKAPPPLLQLYLLVPKVLTIWGRQKKVTDSVLKSCMASNPPICFNPHNVPPRMMLHHHPSEAVIFYQNVPPNYALRYHNKPLQTSKHHSCQLRAHRCVFSSFYLILPAKNEHAAVKNSDSDILNTYFLRIYSMDFVSLFQFAHCLQTEAYYKHICVIKASTAGILA